MPTLPHSSCRKREIYLGQRALLHSPRLGASRGQLVCAQATSVRPHQHNLPEARTHRGREAPHGVPHCQQLACQARSVARSTLQHAPPELAKHRFVATHTNKGVCASMPQSAERETGLLQE